MYLMKKPLVVLATALCAGLALQAQAQLRADVCRGTTSIISQEQTQAGLDMMVEVTVEDCEGVCIGSLEYTLLFTDAENNEIQWHLTKAWDWQEVDGPFTLAIHEDMLPGTQLKEVQNMQIGRCSCSTRIP